MAAKREHQPQVITFVNIDRTAVEVLRKHALLALQELLMQVHHLMLEPNEPRS